MKLDSYAELWAVRPVRGLFLAAFFARIPALAAPLILTLHVVTSLDGTYAQAGVVAAATTIGAGLGSPWRGRLIDRLGMRRVILPSVVAVAILFPLAAVVPFAGLIPVAFFMGLFLIPVFSIVRLSLSVMVEERLRRTAFAADSMAAEASFIIGPAGGALLATTVSTEAALVAVGLCEAAAGMLFWWIDPPTRSESSNAKADPDPPTTTWLTTPVVFVFVVAAGTMVALIATDLSIIAELREVDSVGSIGLVYAAWGLSSLFGGLIYGATSTTIRPTFLLVALGLTTIPVGLAVGPWSLTLLVIPAGFLCAPTMTAVAERVADLVPEQRRGEAMGWMGTSFTIGGSAGAPAIGAAIDGFGAWGGFAVGGALAVALAAVSYVGQLMPARKPVGAPD